MICRSYIGYANINLNNLFHVQFIVFVSLQIQHFIYILYHVELCKIKIKVYNSEFLEKHKVKETQTSAAIALRPCFQAASYLPITKGLHLMMITYNVYIQNIQYKFNLYILRLLSKLFPQECYNKTKIVALFKSIYLKF